MYWTPLTLLFTIPTTEDEQKAAADSAKVEITHIAEELANNPSEFFSELLHKMLEFGLKVLVAIIIYAIGAWIIKMVKRWLEKNFSRKKADKTLGSFITSFVTIALTVLLIVIVIGTLGINTTSFAALLAAGGMAIGMALSGTVQNIAGGLMILLFKPFKVGDYIKAQGYEGYVTEVNIASTKIRTYANSIIVLPNGALFNGTIDNFTDKPYHRITWKVDVPYGTDAKKVRELLLKLADEEPKILNSKTKGVADPVVHLNELKDSSVELILWAWVKVEDYWPVLFKLNEEIYSFLPQNGVEFPFPQLDVHVNP